MTCLSSNSKELYSRVFNVGMIEPEAHELTTMDTVSKGELTCIEPLLLAGILLSILFMEGFIFLLELGKNNQIPDK